MGTYQESTKEKKKNVVDAYTEIGIYDFASSLLKASEIEAVNLEKMKEKMVEINYPLTFFLINASLDTVINNLRVGRPDKVPPMKEYGVEKQKEK